LTRSPLIFGLLNNLKPSGCAEYHHGLIFSDWDNLAKQLNSNAHGHIHELMGGSWNPDEWLKTPVGDSWHKDAYQFAHATEAYSKILWRYDFLLCPERPSECTPGTRSIECECQCTEESMQGLTPSHILAQTGIIKSLVFYDKAGNVIENWQNRTTKMPYEQLPGYTYEETQEIYEKIMDVLCHPGFIGDMFQVCFTFQTDCCVVLNVEVKCRLVNL
jgi:hypothetical protein